MTTDELIAWVSEQAACNLGCANDYDDPDDVENLAQSYREDAAMLINVENALRRLRDIERDSGGEL